MSRLKKIIICLVLIMVVVAMTGCEAEGPMERAGKAIDKAAEDTGEAIEDAQEKVEDAMDERAEKKN